ncbi:MAG: cupredoxin family copper-binding protein [Solirubrobacteraceae bacterium]|nr:cupredoxin family copper-binding protein [Solirubrobacteraceae bacterium]
MNLGTLNVRRPLAILAAVGLVVAAVLGFALSSSAPQNAEAAGTVTINIKDFAFSKKTVTVKRGTTIKWVNKDTTKHNAYSDKSGGPKGKLLAKNKSYSWKAAKTGTFNYYCTPHPHMKGKIVVK